MSVKHEEKILDELNNLDEIFLKISKFENILDVDKHLEG